MIIPWTLGSQDETSRAGSEDSSSDIPAVAVGPTAGARHSGEPSSWHRLWSVHSPYGHLRGRR
jgi:hypothetical protein